MTPVDLKLNIIKIYINTISIYAGPAWVALIKDSSWKNSKQYTTSLYAPSTTHPTTGTTTSSVAFFA